MSDVNNSRGMVPLEDLLIDNTLSYGIVQPGSHVEEGVPILRINNIKEGRIDVTDVLKVHFSIAEKHKRTSLLGGELLITVVGSGGLGNTAIVPESLSGWNTARAIAVAKINHGIADIHYIRYCFQLDEVKHQIYGAATTTAQPTLNLSELKRVMFPMRSLEEQKSISSVIRRFDEKIDLLQQQNQTLEQMAETLYRQWFVEVEEFSKKIRVLADLVDHKTDSVNPNKTPQRQFAHFSIPAYDNDRIPELQVGKEILSNKYTVHSNSVLISKLNPRTPRIWCVGDTVPSNSICSTEFQVMVPKDKALLPYVYYFLKSGAVVDELTAAASGTSGSHQRVSASDILRLTMPTSSPGKPELFSTMTTPWLQKQEANREEIQTLRDIRNMLLRKLMRGEVSVIVNAQLKNKAHDQLEISSR